MKKKINKCLGSSLESLLEEEGILEELKQLIEAFELREDKALSAIAAEQDADDIETVSEEEAWQ